jgi:hypothetical protein
MHMPMKKVAGATLTLMMLAPSRTACASRLLATPMLQNAVTVATTLAARRAHPLRMMMIALRTTTRRCTTVQVCACVLAVGTHTSELCRGVHNAGYVHLSRAQGRCQVVLNWHGQARRSTSGGTGTPRNREQPLGPVIKVSVLQAVNNRVDIAVVHCLSNAAFDAAARHSTCCYVRWTFWTPQDVACVQDSAGRSGRRKRRVPCLSKLLVSLRASGLGSVARSRAR